MEIIQNSISIFLEASTIGILQLKTHNTPYTSSIDYKMYYELNYRKKSSLPLKFDSSISLKIAYILYRRFKYEYIGESFSISLGKS